MTKTLNLEAQFNYVPAADDSVDAQYELKADTNFCVQVCEYSMAHGEGYAVTVASGVGKDFGVAHWGSHATLKAAMRECVDRHSGKLA